MKREPGTGTAAKSEAIYAPADPSIAKFVRRLYYNSGRSARTCEAYARDLEMFLAFLGDTAELRNASKDNVEEFIFELSSRRKYQAVAIRRKLVAIRRFYRFLIIEGARADDPTLGIDPPKVPKRLPVVLREDEVAKLLRTRPPARRTDFQRLRDRAILEFLYASGVRRAEVASLNLQDVDLERRAARVIGKGDKQRVVLFNTAAADAMRAYLGLRPRTSDEAFFVGRRGKRLGPRQVWAIFKVFSDLSGVQTHASPHVMRHSFATHLYENGADIMTIKELLGHESLATTQIYTNISIDHMRRAYDDAHPRDKRTDR